MDFDIIDIDGLEIDLSDDNARWEELVTNIMEGDVIPVIGPDLQMGNGQNVHTALINLFAKKYGIGNNPKTFSQLVYGNNSSLNKDNIYTALNQVLGKVSLPPSNLLRKLLGTKQFPFVITTSFTPVVETVMHEVWGDEVKVLQFRNDPNRDMKVDVGDIQNEKDLRKPTVFYMFGKYSAEKERYVVTDMDIMKFCKSWLAEQNVPKVLSTSIKKRSLLMLGSSYSDWLFRFIFYAMRDKVEDIGSSLLVSKQMDEELEEFLIRLATFIQKEPEKTIEEIVNRINKRKTQMANEQKNQPMYESDVFLSYSRSDEEVVKRLYEALSAQGLRVWYDRIRIQAADEWKQTIVRGIRASRLFVPILSTNIEREIFEEHEYRVEWSIAADISNKRGGQSFIYPLAEKGFDFYDENTRIPGEFQERHATGYDISTDFKAIAANMAQKIEELKLKEKELRA